MKQYKSKPETCEAIQWTGENKDEIKTFINGTIRFLFKANGMLATYPPAHGTFILEPGDFLYQKSTGLILGMDKDEFEERFEQIKVFEL